MHSVIRWAVGALVLAPSVVIAQGVGFSLDPRVLAAPREEQRLCRRVQQDVPFDTTRLAWGCFLGDTARAARPRRTVILLYERGGEVSHLEVIARLSADTGMRVYVDFDRRSTGDVTLYVDESLPRPTGQAAVSPRESPRDSKTWRRPATSAELESARQLARWFWECKCLPP